MRIRWRGLELPSRFERDDSVSTETYGKFYVEPFERGFGTTVGNSLRRILLSSLEGAAVYAVKIKGADHEFCTLPGVLEDVADILLNIKSLVVIMDGEESRTLKLSRNTAGEVTAGDIEAEAGVEIANPGLKIATLTEDVPFEIEMRAKTGRGYATADENSGPEQELGVIPVDSIFSPITRVRYKTEDTRVGQRTNYDRLVLEVWTRGSVTPEDAITEAAKILRKHLNPFVQYDELGADLVTEPIQIGSISPGMNEELKGLLAKSVNELQLSVRAGNCLESARIRTISELVSKTEADLLRVRSFGKTSLREVKRKLAESGLSLGMTIGPDGVPTIPAPMDFASSDALDYDGASEDEDSDDQSGAVGDDGSSVSVVADGSSIEN